MFSLVLIDDEPWALQGVREFIDWSSFGFTDIHCFDNGAEALAYIEENTPDAVITDICMPRLSGLELMERCHEKGIPSQFVMVSAYAEFSYAKRAVDNGAFSYILKPLDREELTGMAANLSRRLYTDRMGKTYRQVRTMVLQALTGLKPDTDTLQKAGMLLDCEYRVCACGKIPAQDRGSWVSVYDDLAVAICPVRTPVCTDIPMGVSRIATGTELISDRIREALIAYFSCQFYGLSGTVTYHGEHIGEKELSELFQSVSDGHYSQTKALLKMLLERVRRQQIMLDSVTAFYNRILRRVLEPEHKNELMQDIRPFSDCFHLVGVLHNFQAMEDSLMTLMSNRFDEENLYSENAIDSVRMAIHYVDNNYREDITLEQLAQKYYISVSYLSRKFKSLTGENFSAYLKRKRIAYACELLTSTELSVAEVGNICGYPNCFCFSRTFKDATGIPPSQYKERGSRRP